MTAGEGDDGTEEPRHYLAQWIERPVAITGRMDDPVWDRAEWSEDFVDILGYRGPRPRFRTRLKMLWDDEFLTIGAELEEPHVWATHTVHDSVIFEDNDFELFIDPDGDGHLYGEFEINALNTTWDLLLTRPYLANGAAISGWEIHGVRTAVGIDGTLNDPGDIDIGWKVEIAIPWGPLRELARRPLPPSEGETWRINFSRVEWHHDVIDGKYQKQPGQAEMNWVWSPMGIVDMHNPHRWGVVEFSRGGERRFAGLPPEHGILDRALTAQIAYRSLIGRWARTSQELDLGLPDGFRIETTSSLLEMALGQWHIDHQSRFWRE